MFFGNNDKIKDEQIVTLQARIEKLNEKSKEQLHYKKRELKEIKKKLEISNKELEIQIKKNKLLNEQLATTTSEDATTGTYNKRYFYDIVENIISLSKREKKSLSVAVIYIDKYQEIQRAQGKDIIHKVVQFFIQKITQHTRESDVFVRFNEDEFVVLFPNTSLDQALIVSNKLENSIKSSNMFNSRILNINIGVSEFIYSKENINTTIERAKQSLHRTDTTIIYAEDKSA